MIEWSNRGPGANGRNGVDVVADGSYAPGDATLNTIIDGRNAWVTWGGTSRSTPVAVGEAALVYQAYKAKHGAFPTEPTVKAILKSSAQRPRLRQLHPGLGLDRRRQGGRGSDRHRRRRHAGRVAAEHRHDGDEGPRVPMTIHPGESATKTFNIAGPGNWTVSDRMLQRYATDTRPSTR